MSQNIPCDLPTNSKFINTFDNMEKNIIAIFAFINQLSANSAIMSLDRNFRNSTNSAKRRKLLNSSDDLGNDLVKSPNYFSNHVSKGTFADRAKGAKEISSGKLNKSDEAISSQ